MDISEDARPLMDDRTALVVTRLKKAIRKAGGAKAAAEKAGIPAGTLTKNLSGDTKIALETVVKVALALSLDMRELFADLSPGERSVPVSRLNESSSTSVDNPTRALRRRVMQEVREIYAATGLVTQDEEPALVAMDVFRDLMERVQDASDTKEIELVLAQLVHNLEKELRLAKAEPGKTKRSA